MQAETGGLAFLLEWAGTALTTARTSAEVLEAKNLPEVTYDAAKAAHRVGEAKKAQDEVLAAIRQTQREALLIGCSIMALFAREYEAAERCSEVAPRGRPKKNVSGENVCLTAADLGVSRGQILQARRIRGFGAEQPDRLKQVLNEGQEPIRVRLRRLVIPKAAEPGRSGSKVRCAKCDLRGAKSLLDLLEQLAEGDACAAVANFEHGRRVHELREANQGAQATFDLLTTDPPTTEDELPGSAPRPTSAAEVLQ